MEKSILSIGKFRGLQQCSTDNGTIAILALDHRNNLKTALNPSSPESVSAQECSDFKIEVISAVAQASSAVLLDPELGAAQCISGNALPGKTGLIIAIEKTGYSGDPNSRESELLNGWSVEKSKRFGANAVKLLVYYHPSSPTAREIESLIAKVANECKKWELPLFLEPLSYAITPGEKKLSPAERRNVVIETARRLTSIEGVDVLKAEFPLDIQAEPDENTWGSACRELTLASRIPWVLLSASVRFETYLRQVAIANLNGASGVAVGRAVWQEAIQLTGGARRQFLQETAHERMAKLSALCDSLARPWQEIYSPAAVTENWYRNY